MMITRREAAQVLHVSVQTIDDMRRDGRLPRTFKIGRIVRIHPGDVQNVLAGYRQAA